MAVALRLYEQLTAAQDDQTRARLIAEAFEEMENRYPQIEGHGDPGACKGHRVKVGQGDRADSAGGEGTGSQTFIGHEGDRVQAVAGNEGYRIQVVTGNTGT